MKKFFKILVAIFTVRFICLTATNISARGMYYNDSAKSNVHSFKNLSQHFKVEAKMVMNGTKGSIISDTITWFQNPSTPSSSYKFYHSTDLGYNTTLDYQEYIGSSSIQTKGETNQKWLSAKIYF